MRDRTAQILIGMYLAIILLTWPVVVIGFKWLGPQTWREANAEAWQRFNQLRRDPYSL